MLTHGNFVLNMNT